MARLVRIRRYNPDASTSSFDILYPQTSSLNIKRDDDGRTLEASLNEYDEHLRDATTHIVHFDATGDGRNIVIEKPGANLVDNYLALITINRTLPRISDITISFNGIEHPLINADGENIKGGHPTGSDILVVYKENRDSWVLMSADGDTYQTHVMLPNIIQRTKIKLAGSSNLIEIEDFDKTSDKLRVNLEETILVENIDYRFVPSSNNTIELLTVDNPNNNIILQFTITKFTLHTVPDKVKYELRTYNYMVAVQGTTTQYIAPPFNIEDVYSFELNYNQTILQNDIDYHIDTTNNTIVFDDITFTAGEVIIITASRFDAVAGDLDRAQLSQEQHRLAAHHGVYTATVDNTRYINIPEFDAVTDEIMLIKDGSVYTLGDDYIIDDVGNIFITNTPLMVDERINYIIYKEIMTALPTYNPSKAIGSSGNQIILDIPYSSLTNFYTVLIKLKHDLMDNATIKTVDGPAEPLLNQFGQPIKGGPIADTYMWVTYDTVRHVWYSTGYDIKHPTSTKFNSGINTFPGSNTHHNDGEELNERVIPHHLPSIPSRITIEPTGISYDSNGDPIEIGSVWYYADDTDIYVGNSGPSTTAFRWTAEIVDPM